MIVSKRRLLQSIRCTATKSENLFVECILVEDVITKPIQSNPIQVNPMKPKPKPEEIIEMVVKGLVVDAEEVSLVVHNEGGQIKVLEVSCDPSDMGRLIGRGGKTFDLLKELTTRLSGSYDQRILVELNTEEQS